MKDTIRELAETGSSSVQGTSLTAYGLQPVLFLKQIVDAAKLRHQFAQFAYQTTAPEGTKDVVIPKRTKYEGRAGMSIDTTERTSADITTTTLDNLGTVTITPVMAVALYAITNYALKTNAVDLVRAAQEELTYAIGDVVDYAVAQKLGDATAATSSAAGAQTIYGGDATADSALTAGDIITTDIVAKARRYLMSSTCKYWSAGSEASSSATKNTWINSTDEPFVLFIGPEQEEAFLKDSQFVNASEYGDRTVVASGEIGKYLGLTLISSPNTESVASGGTAIDGGSAAGADMHRCILTKAQKSVALVWGQQPTIEVYPYQNRAQQRIKLESAYATGIIHSDAVVWIDVTDA